MTPDQLTDVVEFLTQGLKLERVDNRIVIKENWDRTNPDNPVFLGAELAGWNINQEQPTPEQLETAFKSQEFTDYNTNRHSIMAKEKATKSADGENKFLIESFIRQINILRKLAGLPEITFEDFKEDMGKTGLNATS